MTKPVTKERLRWILAFYDSDGRLSDIYPFKTKKDALHAKHQWERMFTSEHPSTVYRIDSISEARP